MKKRGRPKKKSSEKKSVVRSVRMSDLEFRAIKNVYGTVQKFFNWALQAGLNKP